MNKSKDYSYWVKQNSWKIVDAFLLITETARVPSVFDSLNPSSCEGMLRKCRTLDECIEVLARFSEGGDLYAEDDLNAPRLHPNVLAFIAKQINDSIDSKELPVLDDKHVNSSQFIRWAISKDLFVPDVLHSLAYDVTLTFKKTNSNQWQIGLSDDVKIYSHLDGYSYIHYLLERPGEHIPSTTLYDLKPRDRDVSSKTEQARREYGSSTNDNTSEEIDSVSRTSIRKRIQELDTRIDELQEARYNPEEAMELKQLLQEKEKLEQHLKENTFAGRAKRTRTHADKAREAVQKAIMKALNSIAEFDHMTAEHLQKIKTGKDCRFDHDSLNKIKFILH